MLGRIAAVHADVDSLAARVSSAAFLRCGAEVHKHSTMCASRLKAAELSLL